MAEERVQRRLAAILAADVVGYSRLMEQDETGTFERLRSHRKELFEPAIEGHHGRVFKLMGDGLLAEFASVVDAVECAVTLQHRMAERNRGLAEGRRIDVRIGINLGDVIIEGDDRHGEGVNVAARLQEIAGPGGICVSAKVYDEVHRKLSVAFADLGEQQFKNMPPTIPLSYVVCGTAVAPGISILFDARNWRYLRSSPRTLDPGAVRFERAIGSL
jgi:class 3 adenylate cyclase